MLIRALGILLLMLVTVAAQASTLQCVGSNSANNDIHIILDQERSTISINEVLHQIVWRYDDDTMLAFATENFRTPNGWFVFITLGAAKIQMEHGMMRMIISDAQTRKAIEAVNLVCHIS